MARRKKDDSAGALIVGAVALLFIFLKLLIGLAVSVFAYLGLPWLIIGGARAAHSLPRCRIQCASLLESAKSFDWRAQKRAIQHNEWERRQVQGKIDQIYELADSKGWRRTDASQGRRFDRRNVQAERSNRALDQLEAAVSSHEYSIEQQKRSVSQTVPDWRAAHNELVRLEATWAILGIAALVYLGLYTLFIILQPQWTRYLSEAAVWVIPAIRPAYGPAAVATVASLSVSMLLRKQKQQALNANLNTELVAVWSGIETDIDTADRVAASADDSTARAQAGARSKSSSSGTSSRSTAPEPGAAWFAVLGVPESASPDEIRRAWKKCMSEYHPDTVASRGQKLRDLAATETTAINEAYQTAQKLGRA